MSNEINPDTIAHALLSMAGDLSNPPCCSNASNTNLLRQAAALISDQSEAIGVLHTEHAAALAEIETLRARLSEGEALMAEGIEIYNRRDAALRRLAIQAEMTDDYRDYPAGTLRSACAQARDVLLGVTR